MFAPSTQVVAAPHGFACVVVRSFFEGWGPAYSGPQRLDTSPTGHVAYWTFRLLDSSPIGQFVY